MCIVDATAMSPFGIGSRPTCRMCWQSFHNDQHLCSILEGIVAVLVSSGHESCELSEPNSLAYLHGTFPSNHRLYKMLHTPILDAKPRVSCSDYLIASSASSFFLVSNYLMRLQLCSIQRIKWCQQKAACVLVSLGLLITCSTALVDCSANVQY